MIVTRIDINRLKENVRNIESVSGCKLYAVVKAQAYGHGMSACTFIQDEVYGFAVSCVSEAQALRALGIKKQILILCPSLQILPDDNGIIYTVTSLKQLENLSNCAVAIKLNSGMNRLGATTKEYRRMLKAIYARNDITLKEVFTHIYSPDGLKKQLRRFKEVTKDLSPNITTHYLSSKYITQGAKATDKLLRCGIAIFGYNQVCKPVLSAYAHVIQINKVKRGQHIGYGDIIAPRDMTVAVINAGYADGIKRKSGSKVRINGSTCNLIGHICMDMCMADITDITDEVMLGEKAYFLDDVLNAEVLAVEQQTVPYEILTAFSCDRTIRIYE